MKWTKEETEKAVDLLKNGNDCQTIGEILKRTKKSIREKLNELGYKQSDYVVKMSHCDKECENCKEIFTSLISEERRFCSQSCSATFNNLAKGINEKYLKINKCLNCSSEVVNKYCSQTCQQAYYRKVAFELIKNGDTTLHVDYYKRYLIHINGEKCMECGWCERNPISNKIPIELEHIDGDSENNLLKNLKLLCPNCHSLTPTYKALNKGNGRHSRKVRYNEGKSY